MMKHLVFSASVLVVALLLSSCSRYPSAPEVDTSAYAAAPNIVALADQDHNVAHVNEWRFKNQSSEVFIDTSGRLRGLDITETTLMAFEEDLFLTSELLNTDGECVLVALPVRIEQQQATGLISLTDGFAHACHSRNGSSCRFSEMSDTLVGCDCGSEDDPSQYCDHSIATVAARN